MKTWLIGALMVAVFAAGMPSVSEAKRLGSGKSQGMQRDMPARTNPQTPPSTPATPAQQATTAGAPAAAAAGTAAAAGKRSWMGPLAGLAVGLGLAALFTSMGLGAEFANFVMLALLGIVAAVAIMVLVRRFRGANGNNTQRTALAGAGEPGSAGPVGQVAWPAGGGSSGTASAEAPVMAPAADPVVASPAAAAPVKPAVAAAFVPASFDSEGFARTAKLIFIRLQAANDISSRAFESSVSRRSRIDRWDATSNPNTTSAETLITGITQPSRCKGTVTGWPDAA
jgi:predicted lipid-binding transport protein (Tim44 family)